MPRKISIFRTIDGLISNPLLALEKIAAQANGAIVRVDLGLARPYLVTQPAHVQHVLRDNAANYQRQGMFWKPLQRLFGSGILVDGPGWERSRQALQPLFSGRNIDSLNGAIAETIQTSVDELAPRLGADRPVDAAELMASIVHRLVARVFFGDRIAPAEITRLIRAVDTAGGSVGARLVLPSVPNAIPMPGDRAFRRAVRTIDEILRPLVRTARQAGGGASDIVAALCRARAADGTELFDDTQVRDNVVGMFAAGTETTATTLVWFWVVLRSRPDVAERLYAEIDRVVGGGEVTPAHLPELRYTRMVLQEVVRLYPVGWLIPRTAARADVIDGHRIRAGATMLISPYVTHRLPEFWDRPRVFDPERFAPDAPGRHRFAYFPFGGGPHQCIGSHLFTVEAQLIAATLLSRYRLPAANPGRVSAMPAASLRPRQPVRLRLDRVDATAAAPAATRAA